MYSFTEAFHHQCPRIHMWLFIFTLEPGQFSKSRFFQSLAVIQLPNPTFIWQILSMAHSPWYSFFDGHNKEIWWRSMTGLLEDCGDNSKCHWLTNLLFMILSKLLINLFIFSICTTSWKNACPKFLLITDLFCSEG